jgi:hypothetical protein
LWPRCGGPLRDSTAAPRKGRARTALWYRTARCHRLGDRTRPARLRRCTRHPRQWPAAGNRRLIVLSSTNAWSWLGSRTSRAGGV